MMRSSIIVFWVFLSFMAYAQEGDSLQAVEAERTTLQAESSKAEALCYERFAVNACLSEVAARRRAQTAILRKRELALRDAQRAERTREQLQRLEDKQAGEGQRNAAAQGEQAILPAEPKLAPVPSKVGAPEAEKSAPISPGQAAANRAAFDSKQQEAARHKAEVEKRLVEKKDRAEPLPNSP